MEPVKRQVLHPLVDMAERIPSYLLAVECKKEEKKIERSCSLRSPQKDQRTTSLL